MPRDGSRQPITAETVETTIAATVSPEIESVRPIAAGVNDLFRIDRLDGPPMVMKSPRYASESAFLGEARLLERLDEETAVPVPAIITTRRAAESPHGRSFYVMEHLDGRTNVDPLDVAAHRRHALLEHAGEHLAAIETLGIDGRFGTLAAEDGTLTAIDVLETWGDQFTRMVETLRSDLLGQGPLSDPSPRFEDLADTISDALLSGTPLDEPAAPHIVMTDYRLGNLVLGDSDDEPLIRGLIDVGGIVGDGRLAVAMTEEALVDGPLGGTSEALALRSTLRESYADERGEARACIFDEQYERYRVYARADRMAAFSYTARFAREDSDHAIADRWRRSVEERIADLGPQ